MSLPRYPEYKDSGIAWIGEVPSHWTRRMLLDTARSGRNAFVDGPFGSDLKSEEYADDGVPLIQLNNVAIGKHDLTNLKFIPEKKADELARHNAMPGDIVIAKMAAPVARAAIVRSDFEKFVIVADCVKLSVDAAQWNANFLQYWINSSGVNAVAETLSAGITRLRINLGSLKKLPVFHTLLPEQTAIATFLDRETGKIDALIAEQEKLLALLAEKRQATISHAVTKGLNPDAPMKDSGVAWLGEVPEYWNVLRVKNLVASMEQGWSPQCEGFPVQSEDEWGVLKVGCVNGGVFRPDENKTLPPELAPLPELGLACGDLLISRANTRDLVGSAAVALSDYPRLMLCDKLYRLRLYTDVCAPPFLAFYLGTPGVRGQIELAATGASRSMLNIAQSTILELNIAVPPAGEQAAITAVLDIETAKLDALRNESERSIALLKERRSALIAAAVTGQIDVRESV